MYIQLTVGDHEANGFVALCQWPIQSLEEGYGIFSKVDEAIPNEAAGDIKTDPYNFILDLFDTPNDLVDNNVKPLPLQMAMRLAPEQVQRWLQDRPDPDSVLNNPVPRLTAFPEL